MQVQRLTPDVAFPEWLKGLEKRIKSLETRTTGSIVLEPDQTLTTTDPVTGVATVLGNLPDGSTGLKLWVGDTTPPPVPSTPLVSSALGTITILWNGGFSGSATAPSDFDHINAYSQNVTGGSVSLVGSMRNANDSVIFSGVALPGDKWVSWLTSVDANGNESTASIFSAPITVASVLDDSGLNAKLADNQAQIDQANANIATANTAIATKSTISSQSTAPTGAHANDYWLDSSNGNKAMYYNGSAWVSVQDSAIGQALTTANGKNTIVSASTAPTGTHTVGDTWFDTSNGNRPNIWSGTAWVSAQDASIAMAQSAANSALSTANGKNTIISAASAPATAGHIDGDVWFDTAHGNKPMVFSTNAWVSAQDASIATAQSAATNAQTSANGKNTIKYSSSVASGSGTATGDVWFQTNSSGNVIGQWQWSGSAWVQQVIDNSLIAANIDAGKISTGYIAAGRIQAGTITASMIAANTITAGNIAAGAITASELAAGSVTAVALSANSVSATAMVANTITAGQIAAGTITTNEIKANTITASDIAANTITASQIAANTITAGQIAAGTITSTQIKASTITASNIAASAITADRIAGGTITATQIAVGTITAANIAASAITANKISAGAIDGMVITGATVQTAASGARIALNSSALNAWDGSGVNYLNVSNGTATMVGTIKASGPSSSGVHITATIGPNAAFDPYTGLGSATPGLGFVTDTPYAQTAGVFSADGKTITTSMGGQGGSGGGAYISLGETAGPVGASGITSGVYLYGYQSSVINSHGTTSIQCDTGQILLDAGTTIDTYGTGLTYNGDTLAPMGCKLSVPTNAMNIPFGNSPSSGIIIPYAVHSTAQHDYNDGYTVSAGAITVPKKGIYSITAGVGTGGAFNGYGLKMYVEVNGVWFGATEVPMPNATTWVNNVFSANIRLNAGDVVRARCFLTGGGTGTLYNSGETTFITLSV